MSSVAPTESKPIITDFAYEGIHWREGYPRDANQQDGWEFKVVRFAVTIDEGNGTLHSTNVEGIILDDAPVFRNTDVAAVAAEESFRDDARERDGFDQAAYYEARQAEKAEENRVRALFHQAIREFPAAAANAMRVYREQNSSNATCADEIEFELICDGYRPLQASFTDDEANAIKAVYERTLGEAGNHPSLQGMTRTDDALKSFVNSKRDYAYGIWLSKEARECLVRLDRADIRPLTRSSSEHAAFSRFKAAARDQIEKLGLLDRISDRLKKQRSGLSASSEEAAPKQRAPGLRL